MKYLLDSNIIVYLETDFATIIESFLKDIKINVSQVSIIEVLGYHKITDSEKLFFTTLWMNTNYS